MVYCRLLCHIIVCHSSLHYYIMLSHIVMYYIILGLDFTMSKFGVWMLLSANPFRNALRCRVLSNPGSKCSDPSLRTQPLPYLASFVSVPNLSVLCCSPAANICHAAHTYTYVREYGCMTRALTCMHVIHYIGAHVHISWLTCPI